MKIGRKVVQWLLSVILGVFIRFRRGINVSELALTPNGIVDPLTGQVLYPPFGNVLEVFADKRWGNALVVTEEENHLRIYSSPNDSELEPIDFLYSKIQSHYLPVLKTSLRK